MTRARVVLIPLVLCAGCGFTPGASVGDACSLLTLADAQTLDPTVQRGSNYQLHPEEDRQAFVCGYVSTESMLKVDFLVTVPLTRAGDDEVNEAISHGLSGEVALTSVSGLGDAAVTYVSPGEGHGIRAKSEGDLLDLLVWSDNASAPSSVPVESLVAVMRATVSRMPQRGQ